MVQLPLPLGYPVRCVRDSVREYFHHAVFMSGLVSGRFSVALMGEWIEMAERKKAQPKTMAKAASNGAFTEFVNCRLDQEFEESAAALSGDTEEMLEGVLALLETGYKMSVSYQFERRSFTVAWTCRNEESVNAGKTLTSFGGTLKDALAAALVKHYDQLKQDWSTAATPERTRFG
jgi:ribulose bisphosphate carboxylase small subunit